jgi:hypothetical protein
MVRCGSWVEVERKKREKEDERRNWRKGSR